MFVTPKCKLFSALGNKSVRGMTAINCWCINGYESLAMWSSLNQESVAIASSFQLFKLALENTKQNVMIGKVRYIDYDKESIPIDNVLFPFIHKRKIYEHERELRAVVFPYSENLDPHYIKNEKGELVVRPDILEDVTENGVYVPVDINILVEKIYVAPNSSSWFFNLVGSLIKKYDLHGEVSYSSLDAKPSD